MTIYEELKKKYKYDRNIEIALRKILPYVFGYYGEDYHQIIKEAMLSCLIYKCSSEETPNTVLENYGCNTKKQNGLYYSIPYINYDSKNNKFRVSDVSRIIIIPNMYNLESPKGIEVLTEAIINLIKSYAHEFEIKDNYLFKRTGFEEEMFKIIYGREKINLEFVNQEGYGLQKALDLYDTKRITSSIISDEYKIYGYESLQLAGMVLKEKLKLRDLEDGEINKAVNLKSNKYYSKLSFILDDFVEKEDEMLNSQNREEKDRINQELNSMIKNKLFTILLDLRKCEGVTKK